MVIGVLMVNAENSGAGLYSDLWNLLMTVGVVLGRQRAASRCRAPWAWGCWSCSPSPTAAPTSRASCSSARTGWVLGLIGWAYLVAAAADPLAGERPAVLVGLVGLLYCLHLTDAAGQVGWRPRRPARLQRGQGPELTPGDHALRDGPGNPAGAPPARRRGGAVPGAARPWQTPRSARPRRASCSTRSRRCTPPSGSASSSRPPPVPALLGRHVRLLGGRVPAGRPRGVSARPKAVSSP